MSKKSHAQAQKYAKVAKFRQHAGTRGVPRKPKQGKKRK